MTYDQPITIRAQPKTDLWCKPPNTDIHNAPNILFPIIIHKFQSARVTVSAKWSTLYDQGGLLISIPDEGTTKWVKAGFEFVSGKPYVGTVATNPWSDWALVPLGKENNRRVTIQLEREVNKGKKGGSLWVYIIDEATGEKLGIREITWWFRPGQDINQEFLIGVYAARPGVPQGKGKEQEDLVVKFEGFEVKLFDN
jgi:regulation of enolase protein 1 (concanavalin A-like superfamily)